MNLREREAAAKAFAEDWKGRGREKSEMQEFWRSLLQEVYGMEYPRKFIRFEVKVSPRKNWSADAVILATHVVIEQKTIGLDLTKKYPQSDGSMLTPYEQAKRYSDNLPYDERALWIITSNFAEFRIHNMNRTDPENNPVIIKLENLERDYYLMDFLVDSQIRDVRREEELSVKAGEIVGEIYDALKTQYENPESPESLISLNKLCVRLVFCLYADDAGLFDKRRMFHDYIKNCGAKGTKEGLEKLFRVLATKTEERDKKFPRLVKRLKDFPYVDGGLFDGEDIEIPEFTPKIWLLLLGEASERFNWSGISPAIFGAIFESTLNPATRRKGGMHYTSIKNIHKVIDPLFLDGLKREFMEIKNQKKRVLRRNRLVKFQEKLASLTFFDPACGSGNFLTETYISLRHIENEIIRLTIPDDRQHLAVSGKMLDSLIPIKISLSNFYGVEINDFAVAVARTALWIAESQMLRETEKIMYKDLKFLPLTSYPNVIEGNALTLDWKNVVPREKLNYIMGNPPFVGYSLQTDKQKSDMLEVYKTENGKPYKKAGKIDYVAGWYFKTADYISGTKIHAAFVSTNSITQGEQVADVWKPIYDRFGIHIDFAYRTFRWESESAEIAHVHVVIIGFSTVKTNEKKKLFSDDDIQLVSNISPYLAGEETVFIMSRKTPLCEAPEMLKGNIPVDDGNLIIESDVYENVVSRDKVAKKYCRRLLGAKEFLNNARRYCLWLVNADSSELHKSAFIMNRLEACKEFRAKSEKEATRKCASTPYLFMEIRQPQSNYILVPRHSSENRFYIPIGFMSPEVITTDANSIIPNATLYHFAILTSSVHMAWVRVICGRLELRYRYSNHIVYNNFPWPTVGRGQRKNIEKAAQGILDARAKFPNASLSNLYDETTMPMELRKAHRDNDRTVMKAYGFDAKMSEEKIVAALMEMYKKFTAK